MLVYSLNEVAIAVKGKWTKLPENFKLDFDTNYQFKWRKTYLMH